LVERINALEVQVTMDLLEAVVHTFTTINENSSEWNRDTVSQSSSLLKCIDFEFVINLFVVQWLLLFTSDLSETGNRYSCIAVNKCNCSSKHYRGLEIKSMNSIMIA